MIVILILFVVSILPMVGQVYFSQKKLKGLLHFPFYAILISAMLAELALSYSCTWIALDLLGNYDIDEKICVLGATIFFGVGVLGILIQPLIALYFYLKISSGNSIT